jgi:hypothetical protein
VKEAVPGEDGTEDVVSQDAAAGHVQAAKGLGAVGHQLIERG